MKTIKLFLASSAELKEEREKFEIFIYRKCKEWLPTYDVFLYLDVWEDFEDYVTVDGLQQKYNQKIKECDIFVLLAWNKVGMFTTEEFDEAFSQFQETQRPFIYTYFKTPPDTQDQNNLDSLKTFVEKLREIKHYKTEYLNTEDLLHKFNTQLSKLFANQFTYLDVSDSLETNQLYITNLEAGKDVDVKVKQEKHNISKIDQIKAGGKIKIQINQK